MFSNSEFSMTAGGGPRSLRAHEVTEVSALLRWEAPTGPVDRYLVSYKAENSKQALSSRLRGGWRVPRVQDHPSRRPFSLNWFINYCHSVPKMVYAHLWLLTILALSNPTQSYFLSSSFLQFPWSQYQFPVTNQSFVWPVYILTLSTSSVCKAHKDPWPAHRYPHLLQLVSGTLLSRWFLGLKDSLRLQFCLIYWN